MVGDPRINGNIGQVSHLNRVARAVFDDNGLEGVQHDAFVPTDVDEMAARYLEEWLNSSDGETASQGPETATRSADPPAAREATTWQPGDPVGQDLAQWNIFER